MIEGIILVRTQLLSVLQEEGLERIPVLGLPYDPSVAEAVETRPVAEPEHHHVVVKELLRGYRLNGRVARPRGWRSASTSPEAGAAADDEAAGGRGRGPAAPADRSPRPSPRSGRGRAGVRGAASAARRGADRRAASTMRCDSSRPGRADSRRRRPPVETPHVPRPRERSGAEGTSAGSRRGPGSPTRPTRASGARESTARKVRTRTASGSSGSLEPRTTRPRTSPDL